jgi:hypothetical protein
MTETPVEKRRIGWLGLVVAAAFGLFYAYDLWEAIGNAIEVPRQYELFGLDPAGVPWSFIVIGIVIPPLAYVLAFVVGLRRKPLGKALVFAAGLVAVAALSLSVNAIAGAV